MKFTVDKQVFTILPEVCFGIVAAQGIDNSSGSAATAALLSQAVSEKEIHFAGIKVKEAQEVLPYRDAFQALNINPNKFMSSIEALLTRISKKKGFPSISPAVDLGNAVSLKYCLPIGAHDMDTLEGDLAVRFSTQEDTFVPLGETEIEIPGAGELVYATGNKIRTRRWIWRQSEQGKITADTKNIFFPIDGFACSKEAVIAARNELARLLQEYFNCQVKVGFVDGECTEFEVR